MLPMVFWASSAWTTWLIGANIFTGSMPALLKTFGPMASEVIPTPGEPGGGVDFAQALKAALDPSVSAGCNSGAPDTTPAAPTSPA